MIKNITLLLIILFALSISCKQNASKTIARNQNSQIAKKVNSKFIYKKWNSIIDSEEIYKSEGQTVQLKSFVDEEKNIGGKKVLVNNQEIDFVQSDSYVFKPFLFVFENKKLILVQEEDESGINGYIIYFFQDNVFLRKEYLNITPVKDIAPYDFFQFTDSNEKVEVSILTDEFYDVNQDKIIPSNNYSFSFEKNENRGSKKVHENTNLRDDISQITENFEARKKQDNLKQIFSESIDINSDGIEDKIYVFKTEKEFKSDDELTKKSEITIFLSEKDSYKQFSNTKIFPNNSNDQFEEITFNTNRFTIKLFNEIPNQFFIEKLITFKCDNNKINLEEFTIIKNGLGKNIDLKKETEKSFERFDANGSIFK